MSTKFNVVLNRKQAYYETDTIVIDKAIILDDDKFNEFKNDLLQDQDFIKENKESMIFENGISHCLLILGQTEKDGIIVHSSGYDYARYSAYLTNAKDYINKYHNIIVEEYDDGQDADISNGQTFGGI